MRLTVLGDMHPFRTSADADVLWKSFVIMIFIVLSFPFQPCRAGLFADFPKSVKRIFFGDVFLDELH